jgi:hypothetical protein
VSAKSEATVCDLETPQLAAVRIDDLRVLAQTSLPKSIPQEFTIRGCGSSDGS